MDHKNSNPLLSKADLTTLKINNFKIIEVMGLKLMHRHPLEWHYIRTKFHENVPTGSKVSGGHTDSTSRHW
jgi:PIN domain nuclease of toxin-antitoxin system